MILLDTHLISEPLRRIPEEQVVVWVDAQRVAELQAEVARFSAGKRRDEL